VPLRRLSRRALAARLVNLPVLEEDPVTAALIARLAGVRRRRAFGRAELVLMASWKSARARRHYLQNSPALVRVVSRAALAARSERERMAALTRLAGVSIPVASAILTLLDPRRYGVLDIRVWQLLHALDPAIGNRRGRGFTVAHWERYLATLRAEAQRRGVTARAMEWSLFHAHRALQRGRLYDPPLSARGGTAAGRPSAPDVRAGRAPARTRCPIARRWWREAAARAPAARWG
jgi:hypothetical protein